MGKCVPTNIPLGEFGEQKLVQGVAIQGHPRFKQLQNLIPNSSGAAVGSRASDPRKLTFFRSGVDRSRERAMRHSCFSSNDNVCPILRCLQGNRFSNATACPRDKERASC